MRFHRFLARGGGGAQAARPPRLPAGAAITLRVAGRADGDAIERLAQLSGRATPSAFVLVAEVNGQLRAALPLDGQEPLVDPFYPAAELGLLLRARAAQLDGLVAVWESEENTVVALHRRPDGSAREDRSRPRLTGKERAS